MNQILVIGSKGEKKNNSTVNIKKIIVFFSIAIIIFGGILLVEGIIGLNKNKKDGNNKNPSVLVTSTPESPNSDLEDNDDPTIELISAGEKIRIIARDETEIDYVEYAWNDAEPEVTKRTNDKNKIEVVIDLISGKNTLKITAVDKSGNVKSREEIFEKKYKPKIELRKTVEGDGIVIIATCEDGINRIDFNHIVNGSSSKQYRLPVEESNYSEADFASLGASVEYSEDGVITKISYTFKGLEEGENSFSIYAYSTKGEAEGVDVKCQYPLTQE